VVAVEGANGVGKTTLCRLLAAREQLASCLGTDKAWFSEEFKIRMIRDAEWAASAMFFLSGCLEQMRMLRGRPDRLILMDRSLWSTLAVQAATDVERLERLILMLLPIEECVQVPDLTLVLDAPFLTCQARIAQKTGVARALDELTASAAFHRREQEFYHWLSGNISNVAFVETGNKTPGTVVDEVANLIAKKAQC
jgi:thymidylate kinase